jgi:hypothetical protein
MRNRVIPKGYIESSLRKELINLFLLSLIIILLLTLNVSAQSSNSTAPTSSSPTKGKITGRVLVDNQPMNGVTVMASSSKGAVEFFSNVAQAVTDENGEFIFENLSGAGYSVVARAPGYISDSLNSDSEPSLYNIGDNVTLKMIKGGVITGKVTNSMGEPVVEVPIQVIRVRDIDGRPTNEGGFGGSMQRTNDLGIYRVYGLMPGSYIVAAGNKRGFDNRENPYYQDVPTYYPSATRDTASAIVVRSGEEIGGIDISYRGEPGHSISGSVVVPNGAKLGFASVSLKNVTTEGMEAFTIARGDRTSFILSGVPDGEYDVIANSQFEGNADRRSSGSKRVIVKGRDVTGVQILLTPQASLSGRFVLDTPKPNDSKTTCNPKSTGSFEESNISIRGDKKDNPKSSLFTNLQGSRSPLSKDGSFELKNVEPGRYRFFTKLANDDWYIRDIRLAQPSQQSTKVQSATAQSSDIALNGIAIKSGENLSGLTVSLSEGAAKLQGYIVPATEGESLPSLLRVHLIPAEKEHANNLLRFAQTRLKTDNTFTFSNIAPGRYWIIALPIPITEPLNMTTRMLAWDTEERNKLRRMAELNNVSIELQSCQRQNDYKLVYRSNPITPAIKETTQTGKTE